MMNLILLVSFLVAAFSGASAFIAGAATRTANKFLSTARITALQYGKLDLFLDAPMTTMLASQNEATLVSALSRDYFLEGQESNASFLDRLVANFRTKSTSETKSVIDLLLANDFITTEDTYHHRLKVAIALTAATKQRRRRLEDESEDYSNYAAPVADNIASWAS